MRSIKGGAANREDESPQPLIAPMLPLVAARLASGGLEWNMQVASSARQGQTVVLGDFQSNSTGSAARPLTRRRARGFTLVELMVTLAVAAILAMIAAPSFQRLILANRLNTTANAIVNAVNVARMDAIKLNATTQFCGNTTTTNTGDTLGAACGTQAGAVFALPQNAATAGEVSASIPGITPPVQIASAGITAVRFSGQGFGYAPGGTPDTPFGSRVAVICTAQLTSNNQRIVSMTAGSILATASSTGSCP